MHSEYTDEKKMFAGFMQKKNAAHRANFWFESNKIRVNLYKYIVDRLKITKLSRTPLSKYALYSTKSSLNKSSMKKRLQIFIREGSNGKNAALCS
jgi:hypothetical protein